MSHRFTDERRGNARERGYTARWEREAKAFKREHPLCLGCQAVGRVEPTTLVDHCRPHKGDEALFWDPANWQPACDWHHNVVKQALEAMVDRGQIGVEALRLDSPHAVALTRARRKPAIGADGWPA